MPPSMPETVQSCAAMIMQQRMAGVLPAGIACPPRVGCHALHRGLPQVLRTAQLEQSPTQTVSFNPRTLQVDRDAPAQPSREGQTDKQHFPWLKSWYPVSTLADLKESTVNKVTLLAQDFVLWRNEQGDWKAAQDLCPHRLVPLSEGRREADGTLNCAYHGWRFNGEGQCTHIPQITDKAAEQRATASSRACLITYPVKELMGLLWVWPSSGPEAFIEAHATAPCVEPGHVNAKPEDTLWLSDWFVRDLPYCSQLLVENVVDPSHVQHSHHKILGHRENVIKHEMRVAEESPSGFAVTWGQDWLHNAVKKVKSTSGPATRESTIEFQAPCRATTRFKGNVSMNSLAVPTAPGKSRLFFSLTKPKSEAPAKMRWLLPLVNPSFMAWKRHMNQNAVLDGDNQFLHMQEHEVRKRLVTGTSLSRHYYTPAASDGAVAALCKWFYQHAGGELPYFNQAPIDLVGAVPQAELKQRLLDRWHSHVSICKHCSQAFKVFTALQRACLAVAGVAAVWALGASAAGLTLRTPRLALSVLAAVAGGAAAAGLQRLRQRMIYKPYVHQHVN